VRLSVKKVLLIKTRTPQTNERARYIHKPSSSLNYIFLLLLLKFYEL